MLADSLVSAAQARAAKAGAGIDPAEFDQTMADYRAIGSAVIAREPLRAAAWADRYGIPRSRMLLGEFGAMREDMTGRRFSALDRAAFLSDKRKAAEALGIG